MPTHLAGRQALVNHLQAHCGDDARATLFIIELDGFAALSCMLDSAQANGLFDAIDAQLSEVAAEHASLFRLDSHRVGMLWFAELSPAQCLLACNRLQRELAELEYCRQLGIDLIARIGVASNNHPDHNHRDWVNGALLAVAEANRNALDHLIYQPEMSVQLRQQFSMRQNLSHALEMDEFSLRYQPKINLASGHCDGVEALLRWDNDRFGNISPEEFVPVLESSGVIAELTDWVLRRASFELRDWLTEDPERELAVNVSANALRDAEFAAGIEQSIRLANLNPRQLVLEMTETAMWTEQERGADVLQNLRKSGIRVAADDFGTGFSTLEYLRHLPVDQIKIDKSFVMPMLESPRDLFLVELVIQIGREFAVEVVAEGVETESHLELLTEMGCNTAQGYAISKPMTGSELKEWTADWVGAA